MERSARVLERMKGPVVPLNVCFNEDATVNFEAVKRYVSWLAAENMPVILLTYGSSEFASLTDDDIWRLTSEVAEANAGRSLLIASTNFWPARKSREFLKYADSVGADAVKVQINPWLPKERNVLVRYFDQIQDASDIPLLLWGHYPPAFPVEVAVELADRPNIVGMKNDGDPFYDYYSLCRETRDKGFGVISGGTMRNFAYGYQCGSVAYLCTVAPFFPKIALEFYGLLTAGRYDDAWQMVFRYEDRWLETAGKLGWGQSIKTALNLYGLYPNNIWLPPSDRHTAEQQEEIRRCLEETIGPIEKVEI